MGDLSALHDMTLFVAVARTGNFSRASANLGVPGPTLSRRIAAMEREFGVRLLVRNTRLVELTDVGRRYFERCAHLVDEARLAQEALRESAALPTGHVRISMPVDLGVLVIGPLLPEFARRFPGISIDLDLSPSHTNLVHEHVDVAIRLGNVKDEALIARRIGTIEQALFASPTYLDLRGRPNEPIDLVTHECILVRNSQHQAMWQLQRDNESAQVAVRGRFMVNNMGLMRLLAERGMGIAALAPILVSEAVAHGVLAQVLPEWVVPRLPIQAVTTSRLQPLSVKVLIDFLAVRLALV